MVESWRNFYDPSGGRDLMSGLGFVGASFGADLYNWAITNPLEKKHLKWFDDKINMMQTRKGTSFLAKPQMDNESAQEYGARQARRTATLDRRKAMYGKARAKVGPQFASERRFWKGASWSLMAIGLVELADQMLTPGVSKITTEREEAMLQNEMHMDSAAAYTQRQRALLAIHDSQMSLQQVFGNEARYKHS